MKNNDFKLISDFINGAALILKALFTVFCQAFKKPSSQSVQNTQNTDTSTYLFECDYKKCTGCGLCTKVCPSIGTLKVKEDENGAKKLAIIDISKCTFCKNCIYNCPNNALNMTKQYKLATNNKKDLQFDCKKIYDEKMREVAKMADMPAFVNEEET